MSDDSANAVSVMTSLRSVSTNQGPTRGGTVVAGVNLAGAIAVRFGSRPPVVIDSTRNQVTGISPAGAGTAAPRLGAGLRRPTRHDHGYGPGHFSHFAPGGAAARFTVVSATIPAFTAPALTPGPVDPAVTTDTGTITLPGAYTCLAVPAA
ncbi:hypothetical protein E6W39_01135 [Kitasatospora acidiphila]|uniref:Uncharacterized protein n=1 Tax=Kitasatospora acidiphila TaxID=2567942 RepID=A0A540WG54_9ACTN|nr:hypothetical protein [Kitasatospora acidiphila]TQF07962.1 hypothetical protein E6W39_01135 [Kitasatospora acidiphila]